jgi:hypothetical protein
MWKRFILWDYPRASWQYDAMVGIILAFIFLTPRALFRDQPRIPKASVIAVPSESGSSSLYVEPEVLAGIPEGQRVARLTRFLESQPGTKGLKVIRVEPILDSEGGLQGYLATVRP